MLKQMSIALNKDVEEALLDMDPSDLSNASGLKDHHTALLRSQEEFNSSDSELSEGGIKIQKEIDKMTGFNLDIKALPIDLDNMQRVNLTPKNGITCQLNTGPYIGALKERGFLLFETEANQRKTMKRINKFKNQDFEQ